MVFDFGNVLSLPQEEGTMGLLAAIAGVDEQTMTRVVWDMRGSYDRGDLSGTAYYGKLLAAAGAAPDEGTLAALVRADLESWARLNPDSLALADAVAAAGLKRGILSNMPHEFLALARKRFPLFSQVDAGIYSCELGINKPERGIYEALVAALGVEAEEIVFFDDIQANVDGALAVGIRGHLWKDASAARSDLAALGLRL